MWNVLQESTTIRTEEVNFGILEERDGFLRVFEFEEWQ